MELSSTLHLDTPLTDPDADDFGRTNLAQQIARSIMRVDATSGFVFSVNGPWGSGKTTLLNFVERYLESEHESGRPVVFRFNPWWFSGRDQLLFQFFREFQAVLGASDHAADFKAIGEGLRTFSSIITPLGFIPGAGEIIGTVKKIADKAGESIVSATDLWKSDAASQRLEIDNLLRSKKRRIVVFIDDIDRLSTDEMKQVFLLVKALADFPYTIYVLSFDRSVVEPALDSLGVSYLEKIVQLPVDLPSPDRTSLLQMLVDRLGVLMASTPEDRWDQTRWSNMLLNGIAGFITTPRQVIRLVNVLAATYPLVEGEVDPIDFVGIQTLRVFSPTIHEFVLENESLLTGADKVLLSRLPDQEAQNRDLFQRLVDEQGKEAKQVDALMKRLFPRWESAMAGRSYSSSWNEEWNKNRRICSPQWFATYFRLALEPGEVSAAEKARVLAHVGDPERFGRELVRLAKERRRDNSTRLIAFLDQLNGPDEIPDDAIEQALRAVLQFGDEIIRASLGERTGLFGVSTSHRIAFLSVDLLSRCRDSAQRIRIIQDELAKSGSVETVAEIVREFGTEHAEKGAVAADDLMITANQLEDLRQLVGRTIQERVSIGHFPKFSNPRLMLRLWKAWGDREAAQDFIENLVSHDETFASLAEMLLDSATTINFGDTVGKRVPTIELDLVNELIGEDYEILLNRCDQVSDVLSGRLTKSQTLGIATLRAILNRGMSQRESTSSNPES